MRSAIPTRWIEQAESRRVLTELLSERMPPPALQGRVAEDAAAALPTRLLSWFAIRHPTGRPVLPTRLH